MIRLLAIGLGLGTLAVSAVYGASQESKKTYRVGFLRGTSPRRFELDEFRRGLRELGYVEGEKIVIEQRYAHGSLDRLSGLAAELVRLKVDVIVVGGTHDAKAAKAATTAIPVVFTLAGDPVGGGLVVSLGRPGGNVIGLSNLQSELGGKQLQLLKEAVPSASRMAVLYNPTNPTHADNLESARAAARSLSVQLQVIEVRSQTSSPARSQRWLAAALALCSRWLTLSSAQTHRGLRGLLPRTGCRRCFSRRSSSTRAV